jgi:predicted nucleic-acid-binding Zn-ribbon protein
VANIKREGNKNVRAAGRSRDVEWPVGAVVTCERCDAMWEVEQGDSYRVGIDGMSAAADCPSCGNQQFFQRSPGQANAARTQ